MQWSRHKSRKYGDLKKSITAFSEIQRDGKSEEINEVESYKHNYT
jgi:hypothetical protein